MILKPQSWRPPRTVLVTSTALMLTAALGVLLVLNVASDSTPPLVVAAATATALAWVWRMHLHRVEEAERADEALIASIRCTHLDERRREEEAFREIAKYFNEGGNTHGMD